MFSALFKEFTLEWTLKDAQRPGTLTVKMGGKSVGQDVPLKATGAPDSLKLAVGWASAQNKALVLQKLEIVPAGGAKK